METVERPISGRDFKERLNAAITRRGWNTTKFSEEMGKTWAAVQRWQKGRAQPGDLETLRLIAEKLKVTTDELLGVAIGQDPPFEAWQKFLATEEGQSMTPDERRTLASIGWFGIEPSVGVYLAALGAYRLGKKS